MSPLSIAFILTIAGGAGAGLVFIGVLIQWSLRKALPSRPAHLEIEAAPQAEPLPPPELAPEPTSELAEPVTIPEPEPEQRVAPPPPVREPVRIGLGLRKTREILRYAQDDTSGFRTTSRLLFWSPKFLQDLFPGTINL